MNSTENIVCDPTGSTPPQNVKKPENDTTRISGIYKIINKVNGKYYVGSSMDIIHRFNTHRRLLNRNKHINPILQASWNTHGIDSFEFIIVERVPNDHLLLVEQRYLNELDKDKCYNICFDASAPMTGRHHSEESLRKISIANKLNGVGKQLGEWVRTNWTGKKHSEEMIAKFRALANTRDDSNRIAALKTESFRTKVGDFFRGRPNPTNTKRLKSAWKTLEYRNKMIAVNRRTHNADERRTGSLVKLGYSLTFISPEGKTVSPVSIRSFCDNYKLRRKNIRQLIRGEICNYRGWTRSTI